MLYTMPPHLTRKSHPYPPSAPPHTCVWTDRHLLIVWIFLLRHDGSDRVRLLQQHVDVDVRYVLDLDLRSRVKYLGHVIR